MNSASVVDSEHALADELLVAMSSLRRTTRRRALRPGELSNLTGSQLELVRLVRRLPGISVAEAAAELNLAANTVSTLVRQLTDGKILSRAVDPGDRRIARLDLEPGIRKKVEAWRDRRVELVSAALEQLSSKDVRCLANATSVLEKLADMLQLDEAAVGGSEP